MNRITSAKNPTVHALRELKNRHARMESGRILIEGEVMIREALTCGLQMHDVLAEERFEGLAMELEKKGANVSIVPRGILESVCETQTPQGICASFDSPLPLAPDRLPERVVVLDGVQDPGNVGTIWRTADAAGFQALLAGEGSADLLSPKVLRAAMGSGFRLPFCQSNDLFTDLEKLRARGYSIVVSDLNGEDFYRRSDPGKKLALVIGNEARGVSDAVRCQATMRVRLPMRGGAESLNAAVAAGIMMYELMRADHL